MAEYRSSGKELRKSPGGLLAGLLLAVLVIGAAYGVRRVLNGMESLTAESSESEVELEVPEISEEIPLDEPDDKYGSFLFAEGKIHRGPLVLISSDYPIDDMTDGVVSVFEQRNEHLSVRDLEVYLLNEPMLALNEMTEAFFQETGLADLLVKNGYVTRATQKQLYEMGGEMPGCSEFESGYTLEFSLFQNGMFTEFTADDAHKWIPEHCAEFGFVQRYPEDKADITGVENRPWVFRYVGVPHAWYMYQNNLCFEEYIALLETHPIDGEHLMLSDPQNRAYEVYYVSVELPAESDADAYEDSDMYEEPEVEVCLPLDCRFEMSGNNKHGFYITMHLDDTESEDSAEADSAEEDSAPES